MFSSIYTVMPTPVDLPEPNPTMPPGMKQALGTIINWAAGLGIGIAVLVVIAIGIMFMFNAFDEGPKSRYLKIMVIIFIASFLIGSASSLVKLLFGI